LYQEGLDEDLNEAAPILHPLGEDTIIKSLSEAIASTLLLMLPEISIRIKISAESRAFCSIKSMSVLTNRSGLEITN
jgi:hypothetical protein